MDLAVKHTSHVHADLHVPSIMFTFTWLLKLGNMGKRVKRALVPLLQQQDHQGFLGSRRIPLVVQVPAVPLNLLSMSSAKSGNFPANEYYCHALRLHAQSYWNLWKNWAPMSTRLPLIALSSTTAAKKTSPVLSNRTVSTG